MTTEPFPDDHPTTTISVRGEAQRVVGPDEASISTTIRATAESKSAATGQVRALLPGILEDLAQLGGEVLTASTTRVPLTWSTQSIQTQEEFAEDRVSGVHGPTGRHQASVAVQIAVRDFSLIAGVTGALTRHDAVAVDFMSWSVDEDNAEWALVRADAIRAALLKGQDYAAALGGTVVSVDHVADAGLLGGDDSLRRSARMYSASSRSLSGDAGGNDLSLDPPPQTLSATIEASFTARVTALAGLR